MGHNIFLFSYILVAWLNICQLLCVYAPQYLCDLIMPYSNARNLRSDNMSLIAPCHPRAKLKSYGERSFQHAAPTEWNKLPLLIRESPSLDILKTQLKTFLFKSILEP